MKNQLFTKVAILGSALIFGLVTVPVMAEESGAHAAKWREKMMQFDKDGDGKLSDTEKQALRDARRAKILEKFDADGDGELNETERQAKRDAKRARIVKKFDADGDGQLSDEEKQAARDAWSKMKHRRQQFRDHREESALL